MLLVVMRPPGVDVCGHAGTAGVLHSAQPREIAGRHQCLPLGQGQDAGLVVLARVESEAPDLFIGEATAIEDQLQRAVRTLRPGLPVHSGQQPGRTHGGHAGLFPALTHHRVPGPLAQIHRAADHVPGVAGE